MAPPKIGIMILLDTGYQLKVFVKRQQPHSTSHFDTHSAPYDHQRPRDLMATPTSEGQIAFSHHKTTYDLQTNTLTFTNVFLYYYIYKHTCIWKRIITNDFATGREHSLSVLLSTSASLGERCCWGMLSILHVKDLWSYPSSDHPTGKWPNCRENPSWNWRHLFSCIWHFHDNYWKQGNLDVDLT